MLSGLIVQHQAKVTSAKEEKQQLVVADVEPVTSADILTNLSRIPKVNSLKYTCVLIRENRL